jgi:flagellar P-ring protein precursor FlgI
MAPLRGIDGEVYAIAQGSLIVSGFGVSGKDGSRIALNVPSGGTIPNGATVERAVPTNFATEPYVTLNLNTPGLHHGDAARRGHQRRCSARARRTPLDAVSVRVAAPVDPGPAHRLCRDARERRDRAGRRAGARDRQLAHRHRRDRRNVRVMPAAVAHGSLSVTITERTDVSQPNAFAAGQHRGRRRAPEVSVEAPPARMFKFEAGVSSTSSCRRSTASAPRPATWSPSSRR